jgi:hypothetical protein
MTGSVEYRSYRVSAINVLILSYKVSKMKRPDFSYILQISKWFLFSYVKFPLHTIGLQISFELFRLSHEAPLRRANF